MSSVYLIRHGQAGTRDNYDSLSELGRAQARRLGEYFAAEGIEFKTAISGALRRQRETAAEVRCAYLCRGSHFPEVEVRSEWNEFDLDHVYRGIAPRLCEDDPEFRAGYEQMREEMLAGPEAAIHRRWTPCDMKVVESWILGRYEYEGESWSGFCDRIRACDLGTSGGGDIAVFTSATPAAIWAGMGLDVLDHRVLRMAGVLYNASYTVLRVRENQVRLFSLNNIPHLIDASLRTHR